MTYYISSYVWAKQLVFHLIPRDGHVITVSRYLILTAISLVILIRMAYITDRVVSSCARSIVTFDIGLQDVCVWMGERTLCLCLYKFSRMDNLPNFVIHGAPLRAFSARKNFANKSHFNAHTDPIFKDLGILKFNDMISICFSWANSDVFLQKFFLTSKV